MAGEAEPDQAGEAWRGLGWREYELKNSGRMRYGNSPSTGSGRKWGFFPLYFNLYFVIVAK